MARLRASLPRLEALPGIGGILLLLSAGCASSPIAQEAEGPSRLRYAMLVDVGEFMEADSTLRLQNQDTGDALGGGAFRSDIEGRIGLGLVVEAPITEQVALRTGVLAKRFLPRDIEGLAFREADQLEGLLALRLRMRPMSNGTWFDGARPWFEARLGWVPETRVESVFAPGTPIATALDLEGDDYAKAGASLGFEWDIGNRWLFEVGGGYERPLGSADADTVLALEGLPPVVTQTSIEPRGWTFWIGFTWCP